MKKFCLILFLIISIPLSGCSRATKPAEMVSNELQTTESPVDKHQSSPTESQLGDEKLAHTETPEETQAAIQTDTPKETQTAIQTDTPEDTQTIIQTDEPSIQVPDIDYLQYYAPVLEAYRSDVSREFENPGSVSTDAIWQRLCEVFNGTKHIGKEYGYLDYTKESYGYSLKDLNRDGIPELIPLTNDYTIFAIYSLVDNTPNILGEFIQRSRPEISSDGTIYLYWSGGYADWGITLFNLSPDGKELIKVEDVYVTNYIYENGEYTHIYPDVKFFKYNGKEDVEISRDEFDELCDKYYSIHTSDIELEFIPLFDGENDISD